MGERKDLMAGCRAPLTQYLVEWESGEHRGDGVPAEEDPSEEPEPAPSQCPVTALMHQLSGECHPEPIPVAQEKIYPLGQRPWPASEKIYPPAKRPRGSVSGWYH